MNRLRASRQRAQGMTEYIVIVGLIALVLIGAVQHFALAIDEAIEGTILAWERQKDPNDPAYAGKNADPKKPIAWTKPPDPKPDGFTSKPVYLVSIKIGGSNPVKHKWQRSLSPSGTPVYEGGVISKGAADRL